MTGPCYGKIPINITFLVDNKDIPCEAYIHVKGYARANVTHLDLEGFEIEGLEDGSPSVIIGGDDGFTIILMKEAKLAGIKTKKMKILGLKLLEKGKRSGAWVGVKEGGLYIGFKKEVLKRLEEIARKLQPDLFEKDMKKLDELTE